MNYKDIYKRERNAVLYGQTVKFRIVKYVVLFVIFAGFYKWRGLDNTIKLLAVLFVVSLIIHFFFRWKSEGWRKSWWLYKHKSNNEEKF